MERLGIVTDSTCDLPEPLVEQHRIDVVPSILVVDGSEFPDGKGISRPEFYERLRSGRQLLTTAAPSVGEFARHFEVVLSSGCHEILAIHAAGALTAILNSAQQAAAHFPGRVKVVDSLSTSLGLGHQVLAAAEVVADGLEACLAAVRGVQDRLRLVAALDTMEYVRRSGRVPAAAGFLGGLLSIKPIIELHQGDVRRIGAVRTRAQADEHLMRHLLDMGPMARLGILHTGAEDRARAFLTSLMQRARQAVPRDVLLVNVTPVIGTHVGPNGLGFAGVRVAEGAGQTERA